MPVEILFNKQTMDSFRVRTPSHHEDDMIKDEKSISSRKKTRLSTTHAVTTIYWALRSAFATSFS